MNKQNPEMGLLAFVAGAFAGFAYLQIPVHEEGILSTVCLLASATLITVGSELAGWWR